MQRVVSQEAGISYKTTPPLSFEMAPCTTTGNAELMNPGGTEVIRTRKPLVRIPNTEVQRLFALVVSPQMYRKLLSLSHESSVALSISSSNR